MDYDAISVANITHMNILILYHNELNDLVHQLTAIDPDKEAETEKLIQMLDETTDPEVLVNYLRKIKNLEVRHELCRRIIAAQDSAMPYVLKLLYRTRIDYVAESMAIIFSYVDEKYVEEAIEHYNEIKDEYTKSEFCIVLGYRKMTKTRALLEAEVERWSKSDDTYKQGPLLALQLLNESK